MTELEKKAANLLERCETVTLCSVTEEGYPRPCLVSKLKNQGFRIFYAVTGLGGHKTSQFLKNPKAGASFTLDHNSVTMTGSVRVFTGEDAKTNLWQDWMQAHFDGGMDDPNYCVLRFTAEEVTFWIGGDFRTVRYPKAESRCGIRCPDMDCKKEFGFDCPGCSQILDAPWGHCRVKACCEEKGLLHCGECEDFPCGDLNAFAFDTVNGEGDGKRLEVCRCWQKERTELSAKEALYGISTPVPGNRLF